MSKVCVVYESAGKGGYGVCFPGLPGCVSMGDSLAEARKMALEAVTGHLALLVADEEPLPPQMAARPRKVPKGATVETLDVSDAEVRALVPGMRRSLEKARRKRERCVRLCITLPESVLARADAYARKRGETRSGLIVKSLDAMMKGD